MTYQRFEADDHSGFETGEFFARRERKLSGEEDRIIAAEYAADRAAGQIAWGAIWTRETTIARRAEFNARVNAGEFTVAGRVDMHSLNAAEKRQGWTMGELKLAVAEHGL